MSDEKTFMGKVWDVVLGLWNNPVFSLPKKIIVITVAILVIVIIGLVMVVSLKQIGAREESFKSTKAAFNWALSVFKKKDVAIKEEIKVLDDAKKKLEEDKAKEKPIGPLPTDAKTLVKDANPLTEDEITRKLKQKEKELL